MRLWSFLTWKPFRPAKKKDNHKLCTTRFLVNVHRHKNTNINIIIDVLYYNLGTATVSAHQPTRPAGVPRAQITPPLVIKAPADKYYVQLFELHESGNPRTRRGT